METREGVRERLLDAAERLFAEQGVAATSVRDITGAAGANVAAINYYFGSREALYQEVVGRRLTPLNEERLRLLGQVIAADGESNLQPEAVLHALVAPAVALAFEHPHFARLASQLRTDREQTLWQDYRLRQAAVTQRFREALGAALPHLSPDEVKYRLHCIHGAIHHLWAHAPYPEEETPEHLLRRFLAFYTAALRAPAP